MTTSPISQSQLLHVARGGDTLNIGVVTGGKSAMTVTPLMSPNNDIDPRGFSLAAPGKEHDVYLEDPGTLKLARFFAEKGPAALKEEDRRHQWYGDWIAYQAQHAIYASVLSPQQYSTSGRHFNLLRYARFLEVFAYFSPAHGYSAQVTFLGLFAILMGSNDALKKEAVAALENGGLLAFGVSEKSHGSDLMASDFHIEPHGSASFLANGSKHYIGNANIASIITILAKREDARGDGRGRRIPLVLFALRPAGAKSFKNLRRISTIGVRAAYVGAFNVKDHVLTEADVIAEGRGAWDAVLGTVTLGKFFLGFGSIGICEHALEEARQHLSSRILYGKTAIQMPHLRSLMTQAYARLAAMKLFSYRSLDYVHAAHAQDRRYLLFCAAAKAKVSTEGVKVMALLSECIAAKGFEADTYFEMALRDIQLIPSLESSVHINLGLTAQFAARYFDRFDRSLEQPPSLAAGAAENPYLFQARTGAVPAIAFPPCLRAYRPYQSIPNVSLFVRQVRRLRRFLRDNGESRDLTDIQYALALGQCVAMVAYAQLIAENAELHKLPAEMIAVIFHALIADFSATALSLASLPQFDPQSCRRIRRMIVVPQTSQADWDLVSARMDVR